MMNPAKYTKERDIVDRFLQYLGYAQYQLTDPNFGARIETGVDVLVLLDGRHFGIQVTEFHADEGSSTEKGSQLRREEVQLASRNPVYAMYGNPRPYPALVHRILEKSKRRSVNLACDEVILLIAASIPQHGGLVSTFLLDLALDVERMNAETRSLLPNSHYSAAYLYNMMGLGGPSIYEWTRQNGWQKIR